MGTPVSNSLSPATSPSPGSPTHALSQVQAVVDNHKCKRTHTRRKANHRTVINLQESQKYVLEEALSSDSEETDEDQPTAKRPKQWMVISTVTLGNKPRDFIQHLAGECNRVDVAAIINTLLSSKPPSLLKPASSLKELTSQWAVYSGKKHFAQFWQAVIEMVVSMKCQRYVLIAGREDC